MFSFRLTNDKFKIYIINSENKVLYIGATKLSIKGGIRHGLTADGQNGYDGYK